MLFSSQVSLPRPAGTGSYTHSRAATGPYAAGARQASLLAKTESLPGNEIHSKPAAPKKDFCLGNGRRPPGFHAALISAETSFTKMDQLRLQGGRDEVWDVVAPGVGRGV